MSNKAWDKLNPLDRLIRQTARCGMTDGTVMVIEFVSGFEKFNTRPYHNYETWAQGWRVRGLGIKVEKEDMDDAISAWVDLVTKLRAGEKVLGCWRERANKGSDLLSDWIQEEAKA